MYNLSEDEDELLKIPYEAIIKRQLVEIGQLESEIDHWKYMNGYDGLKTRMLQIENALNKRNKKIKNLELRIEELMVEIQNKITESHKLEHKYSKLQSEFLLYVKTNENM